NIILALFYTPHTILYPKSEKENSKLIFKALAYTKLRRSKLVLNLKLSATKFTIIFTTKYNLFYYTLFPLLLETPSLN
ncbi:hypothetical protein LSUB1_G008970, partial [Lachnellula subtilissima]